MANKRDIKKQIHYVCGELALNCIFARDFIEGSDPNKLNQIIVDIARLQSHALDNLNFSFEKQPCDFTTRAEYNKASQKYYHLAYKSFVSEFNKKLKDIVKQMNEQLSPEQRELNKKALAR